MQIIVPFAGPDFESSSGIVKAEIEREGVPLLMRTLGSRSWMKPDCVSEHTLIFVLRDTTVSRRFAKSTLKEWYPHSKHVFLSAGTRGAALSSLAGLAYISDPNDLLCIDLVDIEYASDFVPSKYFGRHPNVGGVALTFHSQEPVYSYLRTNKRGEVVEAAEKRVISQYASAGTYFFSSAMIYLNSLSHNLTFPEKTTHNGLFYVCPLFNGVIANNLTVALEQVSMVRDEKIHYDHF